ncbi:hypothetical protein PENSPDRAFT_694740, partial [Peniophora sp. CONT]
ERTGGDLVSPPAALMGDLGDASIDYLPQGGFDIDMTESGDEAGVTIPTVIGGPANELDPYDYYSSPESKANAEARKATMQKPQDGTTSSDEDDSSDEDEVPPPPKKKPSRRKLPPVIDSSADEDTPAPKPAAKATLQRKPAVQPAPDAVQSKPKPKPTPKPAATKAASSSSDSDSDDDVEVPVPEPKKKDTRKLASIFKAPPPKKSQKTVDEAEIPENLKPKGSMKAPVSKPKPGSDTEEEVKVLPTPSSKKKKKASPAHVDALNAYEKLKDFNIQLRYGPSGRVEDLDGLSPMVKDAFSYARNHLLPIQLYTKDSGVYPSKAVQAVICSTAFTLAVAKSVEDNRYKMLRRRLEDEKEVNFFTAVTYFTGQRLPQARAKPVNMARTVILVLCQLAQFSGHPRALKNAVLALLHNGAFIHDGEFKVGEHKSVTWYMDASQKKKKYVCKALIQLIAMVWMGKCKPLTLKDDKGNSVPGFDWEPKLFPDATYLKVAPAPGEPWPKQIPVPMMAYAATSIELSLKEWDRGTKRNIKLDPGTMSEMYDDHVKALNKISANTRSLLLQYVYREARDWTPPRDVIDISSGSEQDAVLTDEALGLYS